MLLQANRTCRKNQKSDIVDHMADFLSVHTRASRTPTLLSAFRVRQTQLNTVLVSFSLERLLKGCR